MEFIYLSEDNKIHEGFPSGPLKAATFTEKHDGLLRHSNVQSKMSCTVASVTLNTFKLWNSSLKKECCLSVWREGGHLSLCCKVMLVSVVKNGTYSIRTVNNIS